MSHDKSKARRKRPICWIILSAFMLVLYLFSIGWRTQIVYEDGLHQQTWLLADGRFAKSDFNGYGYIAARSRAFSCEPVSWSIELKLVPFVARSSFGRVQVQLPLWLFALPTWLITFVQWRRSRLNRAAHQCKKCGYDLSGSPDGAMQCPECGSAVVPQRSATGDAS